MDAEAPDEEGRTAVQGEPAGHAGGGRLLTDVSNAIVSLHHRFYGRGATQARTFWVHEDLLLCELRDVFLTVERTLIERGQADAVRHTRLTFQQAMSDEFVQVVERLTGRKVQSFISHSNPHPEFILEIFMLEPSAERAPRLELERLEDSGEKERPAGGLPH